MAGKKRGRAHCKPIYKHQKEAHITNNGYLNFLMVYKKRFCGISPQDMVRFGAKQWNQLSLEEKDIFTNMKESVAVKKSPPGEDERQTKKKESAVIKKRPSRSSERQWKMESSCNMNESVILNKMPDQADDGLSIRENPFDVREPVILTKGPLCPSGLLSIKESSEKCKMSPYARQRESKKASQSNRNCNPERKSSFKRQTDMQSIKNSFKECKMSPYARQRQSAKTSQRSKKCAPKRKSPLKSQRKDRKSLSRNESCAESQQELNSLGSASAYIHFIRKYRRKNSELSAKDLLKKAVREWSRLDANQRQTFDRPLWVINIG
ncbi:protamine-like protein 99C [Drosophila elegans]|uniref:protamine-like protein 99C n=1 Tax=Drosophila elegans TaxID=30023 RepID=UPI0007E6527F|nr:protamine-like protein 99C [Drosophila elegans]